MRIIPMDNERNLFQFSVDSRDDKDSIKCLCTFLMRLEHLGVKIHHRKDDHIYANKITSLVLVEFPS